MKEHEELDLIRQRYIRREVNDADATYDFIRPENYMLLQERQRAFATVLKKNNQCLMRKLRVVEVGCGTGANLLELLQMGFAPEHITGIDLLADRLAVAKKRLPSSVALLQGDASAASLVAETQDIVYQAVVFSSILNDDLQKAIATAMWRWVRPGGGVLWYDFVYDNPRNRDVRGVPISRVRELFPGGEFTYRKVTLAPPLARLVVRVHPRLYSLLNVLTILRTHVVCYIRKQDCSA